MSKAKLIFITGPSGVGKSTTASEVARTWPSICALIDFDTTYDLIKSGWLSPAKAWDDGAEQQWEIAKQVVGAMVQRYVDNNVSVMVTGFATPHDWPSWKVLFGVASFKAFALLPELEVVVSRNNQRSGTARMKEDDITQNYEWSLSWKNTEDVTILDNGSISISETAKRIVELAT